MKVVARMALIALVTGTATAVSGTGRITPSLVVSGTLVWVVVPVVQLLTGLLLIRGASVGTERALDAYFRTHTAWSVWLLIAAAVLLLAPNHGAIILFVLATCVLPAILTFRMLLRLCRTELGFSPAVARRRVALHQAVTGAIALACVSYASALVSRGIERVVS